MESKLFKISEILKDTGRHLVSEKHLRIQIIKVQKGFESKDYYDKHKGELLIICLEGSGKVITPIGETLFTSNDQVFLNDTPFRIESDNKAIVELIWSPGLYHSDSNCS